MTSLVVSCSPFLVLEHVNLEVSGPWSSTHEKFWYKILCATLDARYETVLKNNVNFTN